MLCTRCLHRIVIPPLTRPSLLRSLATTPTPSAVTSPSSPKFSTPFTSPQPLPGKSASSSSPSKDLPLPPPKSSVRAGTVLRGLGYIKGSEALAAPDEDYPAWLWELLDEKGKGKEEVEGGVGDMFSKSKKQRRIAAKAARKAESLNPGASFRKVPVEQQSIDLPFATPTVARAPIAGSRLGVGDSGVVVGSGGRDGGVGWKVAERAREELTEAMRRGRRRGIKEANFLKGLK